MGDRALVHGGMAGVALAALCCAAPLVAVGLPLAGLGAWLAGAGLGVLPVVIAGLVAWAIHHRRAKAADCETKIHKEGVKP
ncbi:mercury transport protein [Mesorhizobium kowhaii]|uniref:mercury transport protein n=1 Tax=Mesorhizobium kowhaii TaxID=1300272 RepID=UPI0035E7A7E0